MRFFRKHSPIQLVITCFLSLSIPTFAQEMSQPAKVDTQNLTVSVNLLVTDSSHRAVTDLRQEEIRILEDGKQQAITHFSLEELPVSYGVVVDSSGSMRTLLDQIIEAGRNIIGSNKPGDETFIMRFVDQDSIQVEQGFTSNRSALEEALDNI